VPSGENKKSYFFDAPIHLSFGYFLDESGQVHSKQPSLNRNASGSNIQGVPNPAFSVPLPQASEIQKTMSVYWFNGLNWLKLGNTFEVDGQNVNFQAQHSGNYQLRLVQPATRPQLNSIYPRTISPNGDGVNDKVFFFFENPSDAPIQGAIYDVRSVRAADIRKTDLFLGNSTVLSWDGTDDSGSVVRGGLYYYKVEIGDKSFTGAIAVAR
jgi:hypothetical protein